MEETFDCLVAKLDLRQVVPALDTAEQQVLKERLESPNNTVLLRMIGLATHHLYWQFLLPWAKREMSRSLRRYAAQSRHLTAAGLLLGREELGVVEREDLYLLLNEQFDRLQEEVRGNAISSWRSR
eukprot:scaffold1525_cov254-Pinguiococcus_pyrenoidosus.AAC.2